MKKPNEEEKVYIAFDGSLAENKPIKELDFSNLDWSPVIPGGADTKTYELKTIHSKKLRFRLTNSSRIFRLVILVFGILTFYLGHTLLYDPEEDKIGAWICIVFGTLLTVLGLYVLVKSSRYMIFDGKLEVYRENNTWYSLFYKRKDDRQIPFKNIIGIQLIKERVVIREYVRNKKKGKSGYYRNRTFYAYEINLVLKNMNRINVVDQAGKSDIINDGMTLAKFLGVPLLKKFE